MNLYQFQGLRVCKNFLLKVRLHSIYINENYEVDNGIVIMSDVSAYKLPYAKTIIFHSSLGVFFDMRTSRQIINEFYKINQVGFAFVNTLVGLLNITHYKPFVYFYLAYMPIKGGSRGNTDWIALHYIERGEVIDGVLYLTTRQGWQVTMEFPKGDFDRRVHDVALLSKAMFTFVTAMVNNGLCDLKPPAQMGLLQQFDDCQCDKHLKMLKQMKDINSTANWILNYMLENLGIEVLGRIEQIKYFRQNLVRLKKLY